MESKRYYALYVEGNDRAIDALKHPIIEDPSEGNRLMTIPISYETYLRIKGINRPNVERGLGKLVRRILK